MPQCPLILHQISEHITVILKFESRNSRIGKPHGPEKSRIDNFEQEKLLDSLGFNSVKQLPGGDLKATTTNIITQKLGVIEFSQNDQ